MFVRVRPSSVEVDMFPGVDIPAHVDSLAPASGQQFALLPPDNATGNFTKIVQRIPVKITLDPGSPLAGSCVRACRSIRPSKPRQRQRAATPVAARVKPAADCSEIAGGISHGKHGSNNTTGAARFPRAPRRRADKASVTTWIAVIAGMIGAFMSILNIQITNASLLDIEGGIGTGVDNGAWISTSYLIGEIVVIPLTDYLSRVFSFRRYMIASTILFAVFSMACAFAHDLGTMIAMRGLQGFAGGVLIPMAFTMVLTKLPKAQQPIGLALFALAVTFAPAIGPTIGGYLTENYGWQKIFFINAMPSAIMVAALLFTLERETMQLALLKEGDWAGIVTMAIGLSALQTRARRGQQGRLVRFALYSSGWRSSRRVSLTAFIAIELTVEKPLVSLRLLKSRNFGIGVDRQHAGRLRAVRYRLYPAAISRPGAGL